MPAAVTNPGRRTGFEFSIFNPKRQTPGQSESELFQNKPKGPAGIAPQGPFSNLPDSTRPLFERALDEIRRSEKNKQSRIASATSTIDNTLASVGDIYAGGRHALADLLPKNPFSDEMRGRFEAAGFDNIARQTGTLKNNLAVGANQRGLSSAGSQATGAATDIDLGAIGARQDVTNDLIAQQFDVNLRSNLGRAGLETGLFTGQAGDTTRLGLGQSDAFLRGAALEDPTNAVNLFGDAANQVFGQEQGDALMASVEEAIKDMEPTEIEKFLTALSPILSVFGRDRASIISGALGG